MDILDEGGKQDEGDGAKAAAPPGPEWAPAAGCRPVRHTVYMKVLDSVSLDWDKMPGCPYTKSGYDDAEKEAELMREDLQMMLLGLCWWGAEEDLLVHQELAAWVDGLAPKEAR